MDFDTAVKLNIYETIARTTQASTSADVAKALNTSPEEVEGAFARLHKKRLLVPEPSNSSRIRMAPPFSGVETPFRVNVQDKSYYANCVWDALGIAAALHLSLGQTNGNMRREQQVMQRAMHELSQRGGGL
jgi:alkylmercury lyase-like protein